MQDTRVGSRGREDPLEKGMAAHSSIPAWEIPWREEILEGYSPWSRKRVSLDIATEAGYLQSNWEIRCMVGKWGVVDISVVLSFRMIWTFSILKYKKKKHQNGREPIVKY